MAASSFLDNGAHLTPAEKECLSLVGQGYQSKEIAEITGKAPKTIDKHIENACRKLGVSNRRQAARLLSPPPSLSPLAKPGVTASTGHTDDFRSPEPYRARLDAQDLLHRARSPLRSRSASEEIPPSPFRRMMSILAIAAISSALLAALLGGGVQLQLAVQAADRLLSGR